MALKYIVFGDIFPMVFADPVTHKDAASASDIPPTSAGFCSLSVTDGTIKVSVWGESNSLGGLRHRPEDARIIERLLKL
jgi:hypothetical protein